MAILEVFVHNPTYMQKYVISGQRNNLNRHGDNIMLTTILCFFYLMRVLVNGIRSCLLIAVKNDVDLNALATI